MSGYQILGVSPCGSRRLLVRSLNVSSRATRLEVLDLERGVLWSSETSPGHTTTAFPSEDGNQLCTVVVGPEAKTIVNWIRLESADRVALPAELATGAIFSSSGDAIYLLGSNAVMRCGRDGKEVAKISIPGSFVTAAMIESGENEALAVVVEEGDGRFLLIVRISEQSCHSVRSKVASEFGVKLPPISV